MEPCSASVVSEPPRTRSATAHCPVCRVVRGGLARNPPDRSSLRPRGRRWTSHDRRHQHRGRHGGATHPRPHRRIRTRNRPSGSQRSSTSLRASPRTRLHPRVLTLCSVVATSLSKPPLSEPRAFRGKGARQVARRQNRMRCGDHAMIVSGAGRPCCTSRTARSPSGLARSTVRCAVVLVPRATVVPAAVLLARAGPGMPAPVTGFSRRAEVASGDEQKHRDYRAYGGHCREGHGPLGAGTSQAAVRPARGISRAHPPASRISRADSDSSASEGCSPKNGALVMTAPKPGRA